MYDYHVSAPILPNASAAGFKLGEEITQERLDRLESFLLEVVSDRSYILRSADVDIWVYDRVIHQIMLHGQYKGRIANTVGIGTGLREARQHLGPTELDDIDAVVFKGMYGLSIEYDTESETSPITQIFVFDKFIDKLARF